MNQEKLDEELLKKFHAAMAMSENGQGPPMWKNIFFILDHIARGNFYGTIQLRVNGCSTRDLRISEQTFKIDEKYREFEKTLDDKAHEA